MKAGKKKTQKGIIEPIAGFLFLLTHSPYENQKGRLIAGAAFVNRVQVLGGGCNWGIADMRGISQLFQEFKSTD